MFSLHVMCQRINNNKEAFVTEVGSLVTRRSYGQAIEKKNKWCFHNSVKMRRKPSNGCKRSAVLKLTVSKVTKIQKQLTRELLALNLYTIVFSYFDPNMDLKNIFFLIFSLLTCVSVLKGHPSI